MEQANRTVTVLQVFSRLSSGEEIHCGDVAIAQCTQPLELKTDFRYTEDYLKHPDAIALDPELPLQPGVIRAAKNPYAQAIGIFKFIEDSMPDHWGKMVLSKYFNVSIAQLSIAESLNILGKTTLGAVYYKKTNQSEVSTSLTELALDTKDAIRVSRNCKHIEAHIDDVVDAVALHDALGGAAVGGARPKVAARYKDEPVIMKFESTLDPPGSLHLEYASLVFANKCGVNTCKAELLSAPGFAALAVNRFDMTSSGGREHASTMNTLSSSSANSYAELGYILREKSANRESEENNLENLEKQMLTNVILGNTDDHLKNFSVLQSKGKFDLAPAYDIVPQFSNNKRPTDQALRIGNPGDGWLDRLIDESVKINPREKATAMQRILEFLDKAEKHAEVFKSNNVASEISDQVYDRIHKTIDDIRSNRAEWSVCQSADMKKSASELRGRKV